jgi:hypothetical protein
MNEYGEYCAMHQTSSGDQFPILLDNKGCASPAAVCNFLFGMEVLKNCTARGG